MNLIKTLKSYALYTLLCVCCFAVLYSMIWWISQDFYWYKEMLETDYGRGRIVVMFVLASVLSAFACVVVRAAK